MLSDIFLRDCRQILHGRDCAFTSAARNGHVEVLAMLAGQAKSWIHNISESELVQEVFNHTAVAASQNRGDAVLALLVRLDLVNPERIVRISGTSLDRVAELRRELEMGLAMDYFRLGESGDAIENTDDGASSSPQEHAAAVIEVTDDGNSNASSDSDSDTSVFDIFGDPARPHLSHCPKVGLFALCVCVCVCVCVFPLLICSFTTSPLKSMSGGDLHFLNCCVFHRCLGLW